MSFPTVEVVLATERTVEVQTERYKHFHPRMDSPKHHSPGLQPRSAYDLLCEVERLEFAHMVHSCKSVAAMGLAPLAVKGVLVQTLVFDLVAVQAEANMSYYFAESG